MNAIIFDTVRSSFVDGPGIRTTIFFKGCNLKCAWCHNPESQSPALQMMFYKNKCKGCGKCLEKCPSDLQECTFCGKCALFCPNNAREIVGREYTVDETLQEILKDKVFYESSGGGVTFSGGECMLQIDFLEAVLKECKAHGIHTAVDTAGHVPFVYFERILPYTDLFLYDVKCFDSDKHKQYTGVENQLILENLKKLLATDSKIWVRIPVIPGVNDTDGEMLKIQAFLNSVRMPENIELLPYHAMGEHKYSALGKEAVPFSVPSKEKMTYLKNLFEQAR